MDMPQEELMKIIKNFFDTVNEERQAWTFSRGGGEFPAVPRGKNQDYVAVPFWSTKEKAEEHVEIYVGLEVTPIPVDFLKTIILQDFVQHGILFGFEWKSDSVGLDAPAQGVIENLKSQEPDIFSGT